MIQECDQNWVILSLRSWSTNSRSTFLFWLLSSLGGSRELQFFMSQHRKNSVRGQFWSRYHTSIIIPPQYWAGEFSCPCLDRWDCCGTMEIVFQVPVQWGSFTLKCHLSIKYCCFSCAQRACPRGSLTYWAPWAGCGSQATNVLLLGSMSHASVLLFCG